MPSHRATSAPSAPVNIVSGENAGFSEFLNPKSMLTPGFAGGLTLLITNSVVAALGIPLDYRGYTALGISALFGALVVASGIPLLQRIVFQVLNTLIIFCVAMGSNATVNRIQEDRNSQGGITAFILSSPAYAQTASQREVLQDVQGITANPSLSDQQKLEAIQKQLQNAQTQGVVPPPDRDSNRFFKPWGF
jgi:hypothetical protein